MNRELVTRQPSFFNQKIDKLKEVKKWVTRASQYHKKSIYNLTWKDFHDELCLLGTKDFIRQYGFSSKRELQLFIARSDLWQKRITLTDFEKRTESELVEHLRNTFSKKISSCPDFNPKRHKLSNIHYFLHYYSLGFASLSLGFTCTQYFLNFFVQTLWMPAISEQAENMAENLRKTLQDLSVIDPVTLRKKFPFLYDKPLIQNINFKKFNYTLEELKLALENENLSMVVASLGVCNSYVANKKLKTLNIDISLQDLKHKSWEELRIIPIQLRKIKLYRLFSGQISSEQAAFILNLPRPLVRSDISAHWHFFNSQRIQVLNDGQELHTETEIALRVPLYPYLH